MSKNGINTKKLTFSALLLALAVVLNIVESFIPPVPGLPPGVRLGLSNIITMYCFIRISKSSAFALATLKSVFVALTRGISAGLMSTCGAMSALAAMLCAEYVGKKRISYVLLSVTGGVFHNLGQILTASLIVNTPVWLYYMPLLIGGGALAGLLNSALLKVLAPHMDRIYPRKEN